MFARLVSMVLVAAVIVCPLTCGAGLCLRCEHDARAELETGPEKACCCCKTIEGDEDHDSQHPESQHHKSQHHKSQGSSDSLMCQGVCGGAVFQRARELDHPQVTFDLPRLDDRACRVSLCTRIGGEFLEFPECVRAKNQGRFVRIWHLSFLS